MAKYDGLLYTPPTDGNFTSGIQRLKDNDLAAMLEKLIELNETEGGHKGRIKAVEKELKSRAGNSREIVAVGKMTEDIQTADTLYGDGMVYDIDRIENEIRFYQEQAGQSLLEMGKRFIRIKAHEDHGRFMKAVENVGMTPRPVQYAMMAARKFSNTNSISYLGSTKMIALSILDDDEIQTLDAGGDIAGIALDDIDRMTTRELRETLRKERTKRTKTEDVLKEKVRQKDEQITNLELENQNRQPPTKEQLAAVALDPLKNKLFQNILQAQFYLDEAVKTVVDAQKVEGVTFPQLQDWAMAHYSQLAPVSSLLEELDQALNNCGPDKVGENGVPF